MFSNNTAATVVKVELKNIAIYIVEKMLLHPVRFIIANIGGAICSYYKSYISFYT